MAVVGNAASGKSDFCLTMAGVRHESARATGVRLNGKEVYSMHPLTRARNVALMPSNVRALFTGFFDSCHEELRFSYVMLGEDPDVHAFHIESVARKLGVLALMDRDPFSLSGGEKTRVALALQVLKNPALYVLDQIYDQLDTLSRELVYNVLQSELARGAIIIETHSDSHTMKPPFSTTLHFESMRRSAARSQINISSPTPADFGNEHAIAGIARLVVDGLSYHYPDGGFQLGPISFEAKAGDCMAITGPNGSGKTTILRSIGLLLSPSWKHLNVMNWEGKPLSPPKDHRKLHLWAGAAQYAFQEPTDQLFHSTTRSELVENAVRTGVPDDVVESRLDIITHAFSLDPYLSDSPLDLPRSVQRLIAIGAVLIARPPVVLLDEPTAELDPNQRKALAYALREYMAAGGACILVSHDAAFVEAIATKLIKLKDGRIAATMDLPRHAAPVSHD